jgi:hypothetical protein
VNANTGSGTTTGPTMCGPGSRLTANGTCQQCVPINCDRCDNTADFCGMCKPGFFKNAAGECVALPINTCALGERKKLDGSCEACNQPSPVLACHRCDFDKTKCVLCAPMHHLSPIGVCEYNPCPTGKRLTSVGSCEPCSQNSCFKCPAGPAMCELCAPEFIKNALGICEPKPSQLVCPLGTRFHVPLPTANGPSPPTC